MSETTRPADPEDEFYGGVYWVKGHDELGLGPGLRTATPGECASEIRRLRKIEAAARCIRHWHDRVFADGSEGMVVSASYVRALWEALGETNNGQ
jgi:hypothetical protein